MELKKLKVIVEKEKSLIQKRHSKLLKKSEKEGYVHNSSLFLPGRFCEIVTPLYNQQQFNQLHFTCDS